MMKKGIPSGVAGSLKHILALLPELCGALAKPFAEGFRVVASIGKSCGKGDFCNGQVRGAQKADAFFKPVAVQINIGGLGKILVKQLAAFALAHSSGSGNVFQ